MMGIDIHYFLGPVQNIGEDGYSKSALASSEHTISQQLIANIQKIASSAESAGESDQRRRGELLYAAGIRPDKNCPGIGPEKADESLRRNSRHAK